MPEKLLTMQEACGLLKLSEREVKRLVARGELPAYKIGGKFFRFRKEQIEAIQNEIHSKISAQAAIKSAPIPVTSKQSPEAAYTQSSSDSMHDFFYFNDFYIISGVVAVVILWFIFK
ncbi:MAG: helix-turn-helix domain-containing protein [Candidatus Omnitrophota bacterium]